ncbi:MAG: serine hydrolase [Clostridia bacterium]|nr:serine hydrolase [Clostridia bacterium]
MIADIGRLQGAIENLTERYVRAGYFPQVNVRVFDRERSLLTVSQGDQGEDALFDVASLTKIATATQVLLLIDRGKLRLEDEVLSFFSEFAEDAYLSQRLKGVTVFQLLIHTSTLPAWYPFYVHRGRLFADVLREALSSQAPTQGVVYSDLNFMLLGKILERVTDLPLEDCLQETLVNPYALGDMMYRPKIKDSARTVPSSMDNGIEEGMVAERGLTFYGFREHGSAVIGTANDGNCHYYFGDVAGHAGIFATTESYMRLCQLYMTSESLLFMRSQETQAASPGRGLGFQTTVIYPEGCGHLGFTGTSLYFSSRRNIGVVAFTNRLYYPHPNDNPTNDFRRALHEIVHAAVL